MKFPKLFESGRIGHCELRNRIVLPAMGTGYAGLNGEASEKIIRFYEERAKGGCGLIISEFCRVDDEHGVGIPNQLCMTSLKHIYPMENLVERVHRYGTRFFLQLHHPGRQTKSRLMDGRYIVAPSPIPDGVTQEMPHELTTEEVKALVKKFVTSAVYAQMAGVDGVELHGAHGYLIGQFMSPHSNQRTDEYGGSFENRMRFITEIIKGIQMMCPGLTLSVRISADDFVPNGNHIEDGVRIARYLEALGVNSINVSCGTYESGMTIIEPYTMAEGWKKNLSAAIKKAVKIPVIAVNNIKHAQTAETLLEEGVCDFVGLARAQLADPDFGKKAYAGRDDEIRTCIGCLYCFREINLLHRVKCAINPRTGREDVYTTFRKNGAGRPVVVIGGGPAGMQAAITLADRGFKVRLYEKRERLGGALNMASKAHAKELVGEYCDYLIREIERRDIEVLLGHEAQLEEVKQFQPCAVFFAVGGTPLVFKVPGLEKMETLVWDQVLREGIRPEKRHIVVIGGGVTGLETAELLADPALENQVQVIEMKPDVATTVYPTIKMVLLKTLAEKKVEVKTNTQLVGAGDKKILVKNPQNGEESEMPCDLLVFASGVRPNNEAAKPYFDAFEHVFVLGDAGKTGSIMEATDTAYETAMSLE